MRESEKSCCFFFSVQTGTYIIGVLGCLAILAEFKEFNLLRCATTLTICAAFGLMILNDNKTTRMIFFYAFVANPFLRFAAFAIDKPHENENEEMMMDKITVKRVAEMSCKDMKQQDMEEMHFKNQEECVEGMSRVM